jgi:hypothetical protein
MAYKVYLTKQFDRLMTISEMRDTELPFKYWFNHKLLARNIFLEGSPTSYRTLFKFDANSLLNHYKMRYGMTTEDIMRLRSVDRFNQHEMVLFDPIQQQQERFTYLNHAKYIFTLRNTEHGIIVLEDWKIWVDFDE